MGAITSNSYTAIKTSHKLSDAQKAHATAAEYRQRDSSKAWRSIGLNYLAIISCIYISTRVYNSPDTTSRTGILIHALAVIIISSRLRGFENLIHEASHGNLFTETSDHERYQFLYAFPVLRSLDDYRSTHMRHHRYLGDPERDPDVQRIHYLGLEDISKRPLWYLIGLPCTGFLTVEYITTVVWEFASSSASRMSKALYCLAIGSLIYWTDSIWLFAAYYLVPLLLILPTTRYWAEAAEHVGTDMNDTFASSRNNVGFWHRWYLHPFNDGYHAVHHLHSQVPFYLLPQAHQALMGNVRQYAERTLVSRGVGETFRQMIDKPTTVRQP